MARETIVMSYQEWGAIRDDQHEPQTVLPIAKNLLNSSWRSCFSLRQSSQPDDTEQSGVVT